LGTCDEILFKIIHLQIYRRKYSWKNSKIWSIYATTKTWGFT